MSPNTKEPLGPAVEDYRVQLDAYAGPLDLLLYLVKRHEIDLHDIPVARLTDQYMAHLRLIQAIDVDTAGEFLVMAATLLEIKSQILVPRAAGECVEQDAEQDQSFDPRAELVQQLLAYKAYKDAAVEMEHRQAQWAQRFPATAKKPRQQAQHDDQNAALNDLDLDDVNVMDLCEAFSRILESIGQSIHHEITYDDTPVSLHAEDIADRLRRDGPMTLQQIFIGRSNQSEMIGLFLATLELVRQRRVRVTQTDLLGEIALVTVPDDQARDACPNDQDAPADWRDPATGEIQYDWPDEQAHQRALRRARLRDTIAKKRQSGKNDQSVEDQLDEPDDGLDDENDLDDLEENLLTDEDANGRLDDIDQEDSRENDADDEDDAGDKPDEHGP